MLNSETNRVFLLEALELVASYIFSKTVELVATPAGLSRAKEQNDETLRFLKELEARHAIACAINLKTIIAEIGQNVSSSRALVRGESKGAIRGRIDIPLYVARRAQQVSLPRIYPLLISEETPQTPENALVVQVLKGLANQLGQTPFSRSTAEGHASLTHYNWAKTQLKREPWSEIKRTASIDRLQRETLQRIRKRQTGNEASYAPLLDWIAEWQIDVKKLGSASISKITEGLLAFPQDEFFQNKIFEIWCLRELMQSFIRQGYKLSQEPLPLHKHVAGPVYRLSDKSGVGIEIWFQRQSPLGSPSWSYRDGFLAGIPDIVVSDGYSSPFIVDAKFRNMTTNTRPEETYKMLGYAENFRNTIGPNGFHGALIFVGSNDIETILTGPNGGYLSLIAVNTLLQPRHFVEECFDRAVLNWLRARVDRIELGATDSHA